MSLPLYQTLQAPARPDHVNMHLGLWFERYFDGYAPGFTEVSMEQRSAWLRAFKTSQLGNREALQKKAAAVDALAAALQGQTREYHCTENFVTGLGNPHPVENGFLWHPTLATPYLPGSAVKGLVRALVETAYQGEGRSAVLKRWFGTEEKGDVAEASGCFIFFDALPVAPCELLPEVMTPHMGKWYEKGGSKPLEADTQPGDWHSPVPVSYLVARNIRFQFAIAPRPGALLPEQLEQEMANVWQALDKALEWLGAGAKTAIGFGRMESEAGRQQKKADNAEKWEGAHIKFNRGSGMLTAEKGGASAIADKASAEAMLASLPTEVQRKITSNLFVKLTAFVVGHDLIRLSHP